MTQVGDKVSIHVPLYHAIFIPLILSPLNYRMHSHYSSNRDSHELFCIITSLIAPHQILLVGGKQLFSEVTNKYSYKLCPYFNNRLPYQYKPGEIDNQRHFPSIRLILSRLSSHILDGSNTRLHSPRFLVPVGSFCCFNAVLEI